MEFSFSFDECGSSTGHSPMTDNMILLDGWKMWEPEMALPPCKVIAACGSLVPRILGTPVSFPDNSVVDVFATDDGSLDLYLTEFGLLVYLPEIVKDVKHLSSFKVMRQAGRTKKIGAGRWDSASVMAVCPDTVRAIVDTYRFLDRIPMGDVCLPYMILDFLTHSYGDELSRPVFRSLSCWPGPDVKYKYALSNYDVNILWKCADEYGVLEKLRAYIDGLRQTPQWSEEKCNSQLSVERYNRSVDEKLKRLNLS